MGKELLKVADGFALVAEGIRALAALHGKSMEKTEASVQEPEGVERVESRGRDGKAVKADGKSVKEAEMEPDKKEEKAVSVEDIRAVLAQKSQNGKSKEIKALLGKFGAVKLSAVKPEDFSELFQEAKVL